VSSSRAPRCPRCRSTAVLKILYGLPDEELRREAEEGKVALGGCSLSENDPSMVCNDCGWTWGKRRGLGSTADPRRGDRGPRGATPARRARARRRAAVGGRRSGRLTRPSIHAHRPGATDQVCLPTPRASCGPTLPTSRGPCGAGWQRARVRAREWRGEPGCPEGGGGERETCLPLPTFTWPSCMASRSEAEHRRAWLQKLHFPARLTTTDETSTFMTPPAGGHEGDQS
jgi:hypothetical protein